MPLTDHDKQVFEEAFRMYQEDADVLAAGSVGEVLRIVGANPTTEQIENFLGSKSSVSYSALLSFAETLTLHEDPTTSLKNAFAIFDVDNTGVADSSEFRNVMGNLGERFQVQEIEELMRIAEIDGEGKFDYQAFVEYAAKYK